MILKKSTLTVREKEVTIYIGKGLSNSKIAELIFISDKTVKRHVQNSYEKRDVNNRIGMLRKREIDSFNIFPDSIPKE